MILRGGADQCRDNKSLPRDSEGNDSQLSLGLHRSSVMETLQLDAHLRILEVIGQEGIEHHGSLAASLTPRRGDVKCSTCAMGHVGPRSK